MMCRDINLILSSEVFRGLRGKPFIFPINSTVMQRRSGYRELLILWIQFGFAARLNWDGGDDVFHAGKKDVARLYEYWVFFQILAIFQKHIKDDRSLVSELFSMTSSGLEFNLKSGRAINVCGVWASRDGELAARLSFNRTFSRVPNPSGDRERSFPNPGSWTRPMRPDYTLSFWPTQLSEKEAERQQRISHLHFDAKYRVDVLGDLFGADDEGVMNEGTADDSFSGVAKRSDLLKMHSYRDAIRQSLSAFVIFPGTENLAWRQLNEVLPGLGAISMVPGSSEGAETLTDFLEECVEAMSQQLG
jgi:predicted component of viral defense system (DUF524 family)